MYRSLFLGLFAVFGSASPVALKLRDVIDPLNVPAPPHCPLGNPHPGYIINSGDTCITISRAAHISTINFIAVNTQYGLKEDCTNLKVGQTVCLPPICWAYLVQDGDTCSGIAQKHNMTLDSFWDHNPGLDNPGCGNLLSGTTVCLDASAGSQFPAPENHNS